MRPDVTYIQRLLEACEDVPAPHFDVQDLHARGFDFENDPAFLFHLRILADRGLIEGAGEDPTRLGIHWARRGPEWSVVPLRLTSDGHDFASALRAPGALAKVKKVAGTGLELMVRTALSFATQEAMRQIGVD